MRRFSYLMIPRLYIPVIHFLVGLVWVTLSYFPLRTYIQHPTMGQSIRIMYILLSSVMLYWLYLGAERTKRTAERKYNTLLDTFREPMLIHCEGIIVHTNDYCRHMFGDTGNRLIGTRILDLVHPDYLNMVQSRIQSIYEQQRGSDFTELLMHRLDGTLIQVTVAGLPISYEGKPAVQIMLRDITERKRAEAELKQVVQKFRLIEENMSDYITLINGDGQVLYASPGLERIAGHVSDWHSTAAHIHPDDVDELRETFLNSLRSGTAFTNEIRMRHRDGHWVVVENRGTPVNQADGSQIGLVIVSRDITDRKNAEEMLRKSERLNAVGELAAGFAHEIRNPLTVVRGFLQMAQEGSVELSTHLPMMLDELGRVETITREFLMMAKPTPMDFREHDLCQLVREIVALMEGVATLSNVQLHTHVPVEPIYIMCQENHLKQVFMNLVKNAIEAMPNGGRLHFRVDLLDDEAVRVQLLDEGIGVPESVLRRLGEPFNTTKIGGTGLGLVVCQRIIDQHGGTFSICNRLEVGADVEIVLPLLQYALTEDTRLSQAQ